MSENYADLPPEVPRRYGEGLLDTLMPPGERWLVVTMPEPWANAAQQFSRPPHMLYMVESLDEEVVEASEKEFPALDGVVGIGGGSCMDYAKYVAWKRGLPLRLAPSVVSVDACLTDAIALRRAGRVHYVGKVYPQEVVVDFDLIRAAPPALNRAGAGDILSIHTALYDWRLAHEQTHEHFFPNLAAASGQLLTILADHADAIRNVTPEGIRALVELFWSETVLCYKAGSSRPEEGSEHFWAYNLEFRAGRSFVHGDLIALGVLLMSRLQDNEVASIRAQIEAVGLRPTPDALDLSPELLKESLLTAKAYAEEDKLPYSILNHRPITPELAEAIIRV